MMFSHLATVYTYDDDDVKSLRQWNEKMFLLCVCSFHDSPAISLPDLGIVIN